LVNTFILVSSVAFGALAAPALRQRFSFWERLFKPAKAGADHAVAEPPRVVNDGGWTTIYCDDVAAFCEWLGRDEMGIPPRPGEEDALGSHLLVEMYGCSSEALETEESVGDSMLNAALESKATVVEKSFHEFKPYGVSGAVIIQESHYTIHTWPEHRYAAIDLFYCGGTVLVHKAIEVLNERFQPERIKFLIVRRGLESEVTR